MCFFCFFRNKGTLFLVIYGYTLPWRYVFVILRLFFMSWHSMVYMMCRYSVIHNYTFIHPNYMIVFHVLCNMKFVFMYSGFIVCTWVVFCNFTRADVVLVYCVHWFMVFSDWIECKLFILTLALNVEFEIDVLSFWLKIIFLFLQW